MKHAIHNASAARIWTDCGVYIQKKVHAEAEGVDLQADTIHTRRGSCLHTIAEGVLRDSIHGTSEDVQIENYVGPAEHEHDYEVTDDDREQVRIAVGACLALFNSEKGGQALIEQKVPLSHELGSFGYVDFGVVFKDTRTLIVNDHKFGRGEVAPDSQQNKIYAANLLTLIEKKLGWKPERVILSITQPMLYRDAVTYETTADELELFQLGVENIVKLHNAGAYEGASSLATCDSFCPFTEHCESRSNLIRGIMGVVQKEGGLTDAEIEEIRKNKGAIERVLKECSAIVVENPDRFPHWVRLEVGNARKWSELLTQQEITLRLEQAGCPNVLVLNTPAKIKDATPDASELVDDMSTDSGFHIRLKYGEAVKAPSKRPKKAAVAKKAPAKKKKAAAKKKAAKKKGKK